MLFVRAEGTNESGDHIGVQVALELIGVADEGGDLHLPQMDEAAQRGEDVVEDGDFAANLKPFDVAHLLDRAVILLDAPVLIVQGLEVGSLERRVVIGIGQVNDVMAQLVFQMRPKRFDQPEIAQPDDQSVLGDVEFFRLRPDAFLQGDRAIALHREQKPHRVVLYPLEVLFARVSAVSGREGGPQPPRQHVGQHVLEVVVLGLVVGLVVNPVIHRQAAALRIGVIQRDQTQSLDRFHQCVSPIRLPPLTNLTILS